MATSARDYKTLRKLDVGEVVDLDGVKVRKEDGKLRPGDLYVAERNTGPELLTAKRIDVGLNCVFATTVAYPYDCHECVRVGEA